jgi:ubiquinone/menaquinone biosynthesis C-methylase UbiE
VDHLLDANYQHITVLDISVEALQIVRNRLSTRANGVTFIEADVIQAALSYRFYDVWYDRAVFHFLTHPDARRRYVEQVQRSVRVGGHVIVATFAPDGPSRCSGLAVEQYSPETLKDQFGPAFRLVESQQETHITPFGTEQEFTYGYCRILDEA